jgi:hypothetical protein
MPCAEVRPRALERHFLPGTEETFPLKAVWQLRGAIFVHVLAEIRLRNRITAAAHFVPSCFLIRAISPIVAVARSLTALTVFLSSATPFVSLA